MAQHPDVALSSYLDDALDPQERAGVDAHLRTCAGCQAELQGLRAVRQLLVRLPERAPRRSLLPRRSAPAWLAPARWLSSVAAAVFALVFVVSSLPIGFGGSAAVPAPAFQNAGAPQAQPAAESTATGALDQAAQATPSDAARSADKAVPSFAPQPPAFGVAQSPSPTPARATAQPRGSALTDHSVALSERQQTPPPWVWLAAAVTAGAIALALQWRIARRR